MLLWLKSFTDTEWCICSDLSFYKEWCKVKRMLSKTPVWINRILEPRENYPKPSCLRNKKCLIISAALWLIMKKNFHLLQLTISELSFKQALQINETSCSFVCNGKDYEIHTANTEFKVTLLVYWLLNIHYYTIITDKKDLPCLLRINKVIIKLLYYCTALNSRIFTTQSK